YKQYLEHRMTKIDNERSHLVHMHAEILLIDYLLNNNINENETKPSTEVEIGISKMSCLPCSYYIMELNKTHDRYFCEYDSTHGKIYSKWMYRHNENPSILDAINE